MSAYKVNADAPWVVTCDLTGDHSEEFDGTLSEFALGRAMRAKGWVLPVYGGTFCARHYAAMKQLSS